VGVCVGKDRPEVPTGVLLPDPLQKRLQRDRLAEGLDRVVELGEVVVRKRRVKLLMARLAEWRAVLGLAALLHGLEVMLRDQVSRNVSLAEPTDFRFRPDVAHSANSRQRELAADEHG